MFCSVELSGNVLRGVVWCSIVSKRADWKERRVFIINQKSNRRN